MPNYKCINEECSLFNEELSRDTRLTFKEGKKVDTGAICPECEKVCESINPKGYTTNMKGGPNICQK